MTLDFIFVLISIGMAIVNSIAVTGVYLKYIRDARNVICTIRANEKGEISILDPLSLIK